MIEVEDVGKRYGGKVAVDGLNFAVRPAVVTGFLGPNAAGKSTTMRLIAGLDEASRGVSGSTGASTGRPSRRWRSWWVLWIRGLLKGPAAAEAHGIRLLAPDEREAALEG